MLIVLAGGPEDARRKLVRFLLDEHQFTACSRLPKNFVAGRVVVAPDAPPVSHRARLTLARRTAKLGGIVVWLDSIPAAEVTLPVEFEAEADHLIWLMAQGGWSNR